MVKLQKLEKKKKTNAKNKCTVTVNYAIYAASIYYLHIIFITNMDSTVMMY